jgi:hypothetical protein
MKCGDKKEGGNVLFGLHIPPSLFKERGARGVSQRGNKRGE